MDRLTKNDFEQIKELSKIIAEQSTFSATSIYEIATHMANTLLDRKKLAAYEDAEEQRETAKLSRIAEILILNGGYGVSCEFCKHNPCDSQVSGLTCLRGVMAYLKEELIKQEAPE